MADYAGWVLDRRASLLTVWHECSEGSLAGSAKALLDEFVAEAEE
jgi:hypothetical protein